MGIPSQPGPPRLAGLRVRGLCSLEASRLHSCKTKPFSAPGGLAPLEARGLPGHSCGPVLGIPSLAGPALWGESLPTKSGCVHLLLVSGGGRQGTVGTAPSMEGSTVLSPLSWAGSFTAKTQESAAQRLSPQDHVPQ